ncbi:DODA-type extradiol aromatic ring-opening family dioxygenase [Thioalkalivibrio sulfidiphilus]|uniref:DODA-type extradiol aromatic ring-opening family dioxygenase n=1 Tax=Thioalkalivibrio sulfidiphilus TaxID=1033854 RepID=UPI003B2CC30C
MPANILYLPHGGGPLPLMDDPGHAQLTAFLRHIPERLGRPDAILVISAHWETDIPTVTSGPSPALIYDYYGFPEETYQIQYPAPGDPLLADRVCASLSGHGIECRQDDERGFDHGLFIPLMLMYPGAYIPCIQLSLVKGLDPAAHIALGRALSSLLHVNLLVVGSGLSFHNMRALMDPGFGDKHDEQAFHDWLVETCTAPGLSGDERSQRLVIWSQAPGARFCHPREEHLLPLHVCHGMAADRPAEVVFDGEVMGRRAVGLLW